MKKVIVLSFVFVCVSLFSVAQTKVKLGHINSDELIKLMPGKDSVEIKYEEYVKSIKTQFATMNAELESKLQNYQTNASTMSPLIKQMQEKEITDLQSRLQEFQYKAQEDMDNKEKELMDPIINKAKKAIEDVAKENGYTYIFDTGLGLVLYFDAGDDILPLVKKKLGLQ